MGPDFLSFYKVNLENFCAYHIEDFLKYSKHPLLLFLALSKVDLLPKNERFLGHPVLNMIKVLINYLVKRNYYNEIFLQTDGHSPLYILIMLLGHS